jgi:hypothetical protein
VTGQHVADFSDAVICTTPDGEPLQREGRPGTVSQQVLEALKIARHVAVDECNPDAGVHREPTITEPGPIRKILTHLGEPLEPPLISPARGPPTDWGELVQVHDDRDVFQSSPDELPAIDIHSL